MGIFKEDGLIEINVCNTDGSWSTISTQPGKSLMEAVTDKGLDMSASCGGDCACATCHVHIAPEWYNKLPAPDSEEIDMLEYAKNSIETSRLACQIKLESSMSGLKAVIIGG